MLNYENNIWKKGYNYIAGVDEAGRGPLAGPVVAAAVIFPKGFYIPLIKDSKKLTQSSREKFFDLIISSCLSYGIGVTGVELIDKINILQATLLAMEKAVKKLKIKPDFIIVDGNKFIDIGIEYKTIIKGDAKSFTIASASIIAKVVRDRIMSKLDKKFPEYYFFKNKGYGTKQHINVIKEKGLTKIHRKSFVIKSLYEGFNLIESYEK